MEGAAEGSEVVDRLSLAAVRAMDGQERQSALGDRSGNSSGALGQVVGRAGRLLGCVVSGPPQRLVADGEPQATTLLLFAAISKLNGTGSP